MRRFLVTETARLDILFSWKRTRAGFLGGVGFGFLESVMVQGGAEKGKIREMYKVMWKRKVRVKLNVVVRVCQKGYPRTWEVSKGVRVESISEDNESGVLVNGIPEVI
jgi:hypothetical protein